MEIELKYKIENKEQFDAIWNDEFIGSMEEPGSREQFVIKAVYFDTEDYLLKNKQIAFRIRKEGERMVGTLKWRDKKTDINGLYVREEVNVPVKQDEYLISPNPAIFNQSDIGKDLIEYLGEKELLGIFETVFTRRKLRIEIGETICEVALDEGEILVGNKKVPVSELEIELYTGNQNDLITIGEKIAEKYNLVPELKSKYARAIDLIDSDVE